MNRIGTPKDDPAFQELARARRNDLAAALRLAARFELHEGIDNHFSYMLDDGTFLVNRWGVHWSLITAADILRVDLEGSIVEGHGTVERTAFVIHSAIHRSCAEAKAVLHTHMPFLTAIACTSAHIEPISQNALRFTGRVRYEDDYAGVASDLKEGDRIASAVRQYPIVVLRHHGVVVTAPTIGLAFDDLYFLERTARVQILAHASGSAPVAIPRGIAETAALQIRQLEAERETHFSALKHLLDAENVSYAL